MAQDIEGALLACIRLAPAIIPVALLFLSRRPPPSLSLLARRPPPAE